jgi:Family of unknown function (DUF5681)
MVENTARKQRGRPFAKGQSGNPKGKPKGARHQTTMLAEKLMQDAAKDVVQAVLEAAKGGDMTAARLVLERIAPVMMGRPVHLDLPLVQTAADIAAAVATLTMAIASGDVTPDEAATVASVLEMRRKALETEEFELRLLVLEGKGQKQ